MHYAIIQRIMGQFLMLFSVTLLPPVVVDLLYQEDAGRAFFYSYLALLLLGLLLYIPVARVKSDLRLRDGFVVVVLFWMVLGAAGALEAVFTLMGLCHGWVPASAGFEEQDPDIALRPVSVVTETEGPYALSTSLAFGGNNSALVFGRNDG